MAARSAGEEPDPFFRLFVGAAGLGRSYEVGVDSVDGLRLVRGNGEYALAWRSGDVVRFAKGPFGGCGGDDP